MDQQHSPHLKSLATVVLSSCVFTVVDFVIEPWLFMVAIAMSQSH